jgi:predicted alpha/beta hydrolase family esterase
MKGTPGASRTIPKGAALRTSDVDILIVPAPGDLDPDHWQARWQAKLSTARLVLPTAGWDMPLSDWTALLIEAVGTAKRPLLFVGHGLGAAAIVHAAPHLEGVRGAFLVAPPSEESLASMPGIDPAFHTYPRDPLPFPSVLVASRSHPTATYEEIEDLSFAWGSRLLDAGEAGAIDSASGHGPWPEGLMSFAGFLKQL